MGRLCRILELPGFCWIAEGGESMTLQAFMDALVGLATSMVPTATIGIIVVAGAVVSGAAVLLRRILRAGR